MTSTSTSQASHITQRRSPAGETSRYDVGTSAGSHSHRRGADMASDAQPCNESLDCSDGENNANDWHACALPMWNHSAFGPARYMLPDWYDFLTLQELPTEVLLHILGFLEVSDLLSTSRVSLPGAPLLVSASQLSKEIDPCHSNTRRISIVVMLTPLSDEPPFPHTLINADSALLSLAANTAYPASAARPRCSPITR